MTEIVNAYIERSDNPCTCSVWFKRLRENPVRFFVRTECPRHGELLLDNRPLNNNPEPEAEAVTPSAEQN